MNATIFGRLIWKEMRTQRALWIAVAILFAGLAATWHYMPWSGGLELGPLVALVYGLALVYLSCSVAMAFALERENRTVHLLRVLPVRSRWLFAAKLSWSVVSTLALAAALFGIGLLLTGRVPSAESETPPHAGVLALCLSWGCALVLACSLIFALRTRHVIASLLLSGFFAITLAFVLSNITAFALQPVHNRLGYVPVWPAIFIPASLILPFIAWALFDGLRWLDRMRRTEDDREGGDISPTAAAVATSWQEAVAPRRGLFGWLLWQHLRQSLGVMLLFGLVQSLFVLIAVGQAIHYGREDFAERQFLALLFLCFPFLAASFAFHGDQRRDGYRFLGAQGVSPRAVWWSRQLVWGLFYSAFGAVALGVCILAAVWMGRQPFEVGMLWLRPEILLDWLFIAIVFYACGQFASHITRSGVIAFALGPILMIAMANWIALMTALSLDPLWSATPIAVGLLVATRLRTNEWLIDRPTWRGRLRWMGAIALSFVCILIFVPNARLMQVPDGDDPGFSLEEFTSASRTPHWGEKHELFCQAAAGLYLGHRGVPEGEYDEESMRCIREAAAIEGRSAFLDTQLIRDKDGGDDYQPEYEWYRGFHRDFIRWGDECLEDGRIDEAIDCYRASNQLGLYDSSVATAYFQRMERVCDSPDVTPEQLRAVIKELEAMKPSESPVFGEVKTSYALTMFDLLDGRSPRAADGWECYVQQAWLRGMPWERKRAVRELNRRTREVLGAARNLAGYLELSLEERPVQTRMGGQSQEWEDLGSWIAFMNRLTPSEERAINMLADWEVERRELLVRCAVRAYRLEHEGDEPLTREDLAPEYLRRVPALESVRWNDLRGAPPEVEMDGGEGYGEYGDFGIGEGYGLPE